MQAGPRVGPEVSVIIPVYNGEAGIRACVNSVLSSHVPRGSMEILCVDNASTDKTLEILRSFGPAVEIIKETKRGAAAARNAALRRARGTFAVFTDADCTVHPDWVAKILEPLRNGTADAVGGKILARPEAKAVERFGVLIHDHQKAIELDSPPYIISMNLASRVDLLLSMQGFDERWIRMQDVDLSFRLVEAGLRLRYCREAVIYHHNRDTISTLIREGFIHGYYQPAFHAAHASFLHSYQRNGAKPTQREVPDPDLRAWQLAALWRLFNTAKTAGRLKGRFFPPVSIQ